MKQKWLLYGDSYKNEDLQEKEESLSQLVTIDVIKKELKNIETKQIQLNEVKDAVCLEE